MKRQCFILILLSVLIGLMWSCKSKCPLPSCEIRMEHHHALHFTNTKAYDKQHKKEVKELKKKQQQAAKASEDSLVNVQAKDEQEANLDPSNDVGLQQERRMNKEKEASEGEADEPKKKKKKKKKGEGDAEEGNDEFATNNKEAKKEIKAADKESKKLEKEAKQAAKKESENTKEAATVYRSRITPWWKKNQKPKVGENYKVPKEKVEENKQEYRW